MSGRMNTRLALTMLAALAVTLAGCTAATETGTSDATTGTAATTVESVPWATMSSDTGWPCATEDNAGRTAIDEYVEAWNRGDADALTGMLTGTYEGHMACKYEAALATGLTLDADFDACELTATDDGDVVRTWDMNVWMFDLSTSYYGDGILSGAEIPRDLVAAYQGDDEDALAFWDCDGCDWTDEAHTDAQDAVIEAYVAAFDARDLDAVMALFATDPTWAPTSEQTRATHEILFSTGLTLSVDLDDGTYALTDADGTTLNPGRSGPCLLQWAPVFMFSQDGAGDLLVDTGLGLIVVELDDAQHVLDVSTREALDDALGL
ncbi:hypothetical protein [Demequina rhizosphaerae]|uniref:hypothetical protein n=1 Tax=Demequina rhizosphaerae TaxID=1638985 RepID=UPI0007858254|nr:hypothetical protein [Demequina rhizosphaerae]